MAHESTIAENLRYPVIYNVSQRSNRYNTVMHLPLTVLGVSKY